MKGPRQQWIGQWQKQQPKLLEEYNWSCDQLKVESGTTQNLIGNSVGSESEDKMLISTM